MGYPHINCGDVPMPPTPVAAATLMETEVEKSELQRNAIAMKDTISATNTPLQTVTPSVLSCNRRMPPNMRRARRTKSVAVIAQKACRKYGCVEVFPMTPARTAMTEEAKKSRPNPASMKFATANTRKTTKGHLTACIRTPEVSSLWEHRHFDRE